MAKLIFTGTQIDEAIRKVKAGYADVSKVTANGSDVRAGKTIVDANKVEHEGTLGNAEVAANVTLTTKTYLSNDASDYPVTITPKATVNQAGVIKNTKIGTKQTRYIQTEEKTVTPNGDIQVITPSSGKLLKKVTVGAIPEAPEYPISNFPCPYFYYYYSKTSSSSTTNYYVCRFTANTIASNLTVKAGVSKVNTKVYLVPLSISSSSGDTYLWGTMFLIDSTSRRLKDGTIVLSAGESFESEGSKYAPKGILTYTSGGQIQFKFTENYDGMGAKTSDANTDYSKLLFSVYKDGTTYGVVIDAEKWSIGTQRIGQKVSSTTRRASQRGCVGNPMIADGVSSYNMQAAGCLLSNYAPVYFEWNYVNESTSFQLAMMTHGGGTKYYIPRETKKLDDPVLSVSSAGVASWNAISNATSYSISITGKASYNVSTSATSYNLLNKITSGGTYYIRVRATSSTLASDYSNKVTFVLALAAPVISINQSVLSWSSVTNATSYYVYKNGSLWFTTTATRVDLNNYSAEGGTYSITVRAYKSGWDLSEASNAVSYTKLNTPVLSLSEQGILSWDAVTNATYYIVEIDYDETINTSLRLVDLNEYINIEETHRIGVRAYGANGIYSSEAVISTGSSDGTSFETAIPLILDGSSIMLDDQVVADSSYPTKYYRLTPYESGNYELYCESDYDTYGTLYDQYGNEITSSDDDYGMNFHIEYFFEEGETYYLGVRQYSDELFEFTLVIDEIPYVACFVEGTQITMADNTIKNVEDITYDDDLLVWDFYEGKLNHAKPTWIKITEVINEYKKVTLSNGTILKLAGEDGNCHRLFNITKQQMLYANECVGDEVYTLDGIATVVSCESITEEVKYYNLLTEKYLDCFANRVLTGSQLNNVYHISDMKYDSNERLISLEDEQAKWVKIETKRKKV